MQKANRLEIRELRAELRKKKTICRRCDKHIAIDAHHQDGNHSNNVPANLVPWCKRCHNEHHGITDNLTELGLIVRAYEEVQGMRVAMSNRIAAYVSLGYSAGVLKKLHDDVLVPEEGVLSLAIEQSLCDVPIYKAWLKHVDGIGPMIAGKLLHHIGSVDKFPTVSALWAYAGLHVIDGRAAKKKRRETANWNHALKVVAVGLIPEQFIKLDKGKFGRQLYDQYKNFYEATHDEKCPIWSHPAAEIKSGGTKATVKGKGGCSRKGHVNDMARRKLGKIFLACLWAAWREVEELPVTEPYAAKMGHIHIIHPWDWIRGDKRTYDLRVELARYDQLELAQPGHV